jgi:hypothetical protein
MKRIHFRVYYYYESYCYVCIILSRVRRLYKTGFGLTTRIIGLQVSTLNYSIDTLKLNTAESL